MARTTSETAEQVRERLIAQLEDSSLSAEDIELIEKKLKVLDSAGE